MGVTLYRPVLLDPDDDEWRSEGPYYSDPKLARAFIEGYVLSLVGSDVFNKEKCAWSKSGDENEHIVFGHYRQNFGEIETLKTRD